MLIQTKNYGFQAYLILKYNAELESNKTLNITTNKNELTLIQEYNKSEFNLYNEILKKIVKG